MKKYLRSFYAMVSVAAILGITLVSVVSCSSPFSPSANDSDTDKSNITVQNNASSIAEAINESPLLSNYILTSLLNNGSIVFQSYDDYAVPEDQGNVNTSIADAVSGAISYFELYVNSFTFSNQVCTSNINVLNTKLENGITFDLEYNNQTSLVNLTNNIPYVLHKLEQYLNSSNNRQLIVTNLIENDMISYANNTWSVSGGNNNILWMSNWLNDENSSVNIISSAFPNNLGWDLIAPTVSTFTGESVLLLNSDIQLQDTSLIFDFSYLGVSCPNTINIHLSGYQSEATN